MAEIRGLPDLIEAFLSFTRTAPSPFIYRKWGALFAVGSVMTRRTWTASINSKIYPNMAVIFVGQPGTGKGPTIDPVEMLLRGVDFSNNPVLTKQGIRIGPNDTTAPGLFDELLDERSNKTFSHDGKEHTFQTLTLISEELAAFFHSLDLRMMGYIIRLLNCQSMSQRLRKQEQLIEIPTPVISLLGGVQPDTLQEIFPQPAWGMGLTARTIFVFSDEEQRVPVFHPTDATDIYLDAIRSNPLFRPIIADLVQVAKLSGPFNYSKEAADRINDWWLGGGAAKSRPTHPRLRNYGGKRILHLVRLSMIRNAARSNLMLVELQDVENAILDLLEVEEHMPNIFSQMVGTDSQANAVDDIAHHISSIYLTTKKPIPHHLLLNIIAQKVPIQSVNNVVNLLLDQHVIEEIQLEKRYPGAGGRKGYVPTSCLIEDFDSPMAAH